jgi:holo-[acyl-carrier protein] synthase
MAPMSRLRVGIDLVHVGRIAASVASFGDRFLARIYTPTELDYARGEPERLAARFAAKEAAKKALDLDGVAWRDIEVVRGANGALDLCLHGAARAAADVLGAHELALSMSHEGDYATAIVIAQCSTASEAEGRA